jgi:uncharacterized protein YeaO (DUF488 family)
MEVVMVPGARFEIRRIYDHDREAGEYRVLVDRLWPRGISKSDADLDEWGKDVAPSTDLRRWYGHDPSRFGDFARRYQDELRSDPAAAGVSRLRARADEQPVILLTATRDLEHSGARVLRDHLAGKREGPAG